MDTRFKAATTRATTNADGTGVVPDFTTGGQVTVVVNGGTSVGDRIIVTYHNVKVHPLTELEIAAVAAGNPHMEYFRASESTNYRTTATDSATAQAFEYSDPSAVQPTFDTPLTATEIAALTAAQKTILDTVAFDVTLPTQSVVAVRPSGVKAGAPRDTVTLTYTVQDSVFAENEIKFRLPIGWGPQSIDFTLAGWHY